MGISVQELKHAARLQEWSARVAECRSSGIGVKLQSTDCLLL